MKLASLQLRKLLSQYSSILPEGARERIVVDKAGLAYPLFGSYFSGADLNFCDNDSRGKMNAIVRHINAIQNYVDDAEQHARDYGFNLVYIIGDAPETRSISLNFDHNTASMYRIGVGKTPFTSAHSIELFCNMIKSGHDRFEDRYKTIRELAEKLR